MKIRKNDQVVVIAGRDRSKKGRVLSVDPAKRRVIVEGVGMIKRHTKPNPQANQPGGIIEREASIDISNVQLFNSATGKGARVGFKTLEDGRKVRVFRPSGEVVDV